MASSYTGNSGIEKPGDGDQSGSWGDTINTNMDIIDRSINGVGAITLSGTTHTLTTTDGTLSDGMYKVLVLGGSPSGTNTITIAPNDADKVYIVVNSSGQTATFTQGSGANVSVLNGDSKIIYADGAGSGAAVVDITANLSFSSVNIDGGTIDGTVIGGASAAAGTFTTVTASGEIDGASLDISGNADIDGTLETDALSIASTTVTSTAAELNYNDTGAAVGTVVASKTVTADANKDVASFRNITLTGELDAGSLDISGDADIDGTLETDALSIASTAVTATAAEINYLDITTLGTSEASKAVTVDSSGDLIVPDSDKFKFGAGSDMQLYHDGTNSYITNGTGILKIATETSGIALTIGHGTSEVTFGDNVTVTGDFTVNGTTTTINTTNLTVTDPLVKYGQGYTGTAYDEGFIITRGNGSATNTANKGFIWDESADEFAAIACNTEDGTTAGNVTINSYADLQVDKLTGGSLDISGDADIDGTLEADAMTLNGTAITTTATLSTGISNTNVPVFTSGVADDDFLRVAGTSIEGRSAAEVLSDIGASAVAGSSSIVTTGALNSGSITSGFGTINNGSSTITTSGVVTSGSLLVGDAGTIGSASDTDAVAISSAGQVSFSATNAIKIPVGTTAQRPSNAAGLIRYNSTLGQFEGYTSAWGGLGGGATGGGADQVFVENSDDVTTNYTITSGKNAMSVGPITVESGVVVTIPSGSRWVVL
jgi:cytoskeletal protein CcmA (bactofilin family)